MKMGRGKMKFLKAAFYVSTVLGAGVAAPALAQEKAGPTEQRGGEEIIVTARRVAERLQDVPISMTVFNQQQLTDRNVGNAADLATYTPGLTANGNGSTTRLSIRSFTQDIRTAPSVGVYFAEVVAPRAGISGN